MSRMAGNGGSGGNGLIVEDEQQLFDWGIENRLDQYYDGAHHPPHLQQGHGHGHGHGHGGGHGGGHGEFEGTSLEESGYGYEPSSGSTTSLPPVSSLCAMRSSMSPSSSLSSALTASPSTTTLEPSSQLTSRRSSARVGRRPNLPTVDMDANELLKVERKRARNRVAASKCRLRKLERIAVLDRQAQQLRAENEQLQTLCESLRSQLCNIKQELHWHLEQGCKISGYESHDGSPDSSTNAHLILERVKTEKDCIDTS